RRPRARTPRPGPRRCRGLARLLDGARGHMRRARPEASELKRNLIRLIAVLVAVDRLFRHRHPTGDAASAPEPGDPGDPVDPVDPGGPGDPFAEYAAAALFA